MNTFLWKRSWTCSKFQFLLLFSAIILSSKLCAQGDLLVAPKRAVFEGRERHKEITLSNIGNDTTRYSISFLHYKMSEDGSLQELPAKDSSLQFADSFVRFFPRSVTLPPGESQVVRLQLMQTGEMQTGEYRTHLYLRSVRKQKPKEDTVAKKTGKNEITLKLNAVFGIAVPVIVRVGESTTKVGVSHGSFQLAGKPMVSLSLDRTGNMSCYGDISVDHISPAGKVTRVGELNGIAVYLPLTKREVKLALRTTTDVDYTKGKLHVVYQSPENNNQQSTGQTEIYLN